MNSNTFDLKKGKLVFEDDKIIISDNARYLKRSRIISSVFLIALGIFNLISFIKNSDVHARWSGISVGIFGLIFFVNGLLTNVEGEIYLKDVKSMKVRRFLFREYLLIKLANNKTRQVSGIYNAERLEEYIATISLPK